MTASATIYDPLRRKQVARTPEEEVRQGVIAWLRDSRHIPEGLMESEYDFIYNRRHYRADILVFNRQLQPQPHAVRTVAATTILSRFRKTCKLFPRPGSWP